MDGPLKASLLRAPLALCGANNVAIRRAKLLPQLQHVTRVLINHKRCNNMYLCCTTRCYNIVVSNPLLCVRLSKVRQPSLIVPCCWIQPATTNILSKQAKTKVCFSPMCWVQKFLASSGNEEGWIVTAPRMWETFLAVSLPPFSQNQGSIYHKSLPLYS